MAIHAIIDKEDIMTDNFYSLFDQPMEETSTVKKEPDNVAAKENSNEDEETCVQSSELSELGQTDTSILNNSSTDNLPEADSINQDDNSDNLQSILPTVSSDTDDFQETMRTAVINITGTMDKLADKVTMMESKISRLAAYDVAVDALKRSLAANLTNEKNLHEEVEAYKRGTYFTNIRPFLAFIIEMLCEIKTSLKQYTDEKDSFIAEHGESLFDEICGLLSFYADAFESQLTIQGVTITSYENGEMFISGNQRIVKTIKTDNKEENGVIAEVLSDCYSYDKTVLKPAKVNVYKYAVKP